MYINTNSSVTPGKHQRATTVNRYKDIYIETCEEDNFNSNNPNNRDKDIHYSNPFAVNKPKQQTENLLKNKDGHGRDNRDSNPNNYHISHNRFNSTGKKKPEASSHSNNVNVVNHQNINNNPNQLINPSGTLPRSRK